MLTATLSSLHFAGAEPKAEKISNLPKVTLVAAKTDSSHSDMSAPHPQSPPPTVCISKSPKKGFAEFSPQMKLLDTSYSVSGDSVTHRSVMMN